MSSLSIGQNTANLLMGKLETTKSPTANSKSNKPAQIFQEKGPSLDPALPWIEAEKKQREDGQILLRLKRKHYGDKKRLNSLLIKKEDLEKLYPKPNDKVLVRSPSNKKIFAVAQPEFDLDNEGYEYGYIVPVSPEQFAELKKATPYQNVANKDDSKPKEVTIEQKSNLLETKDSKPKEVTIEQKSNLLETKEPEKAKQKFSLPTFIQGLLSSVIKFLRDCGRRIASCFRKSQKEPKKELDFEKDSPLIIDKKAKFVRSKLPDPEGEIYNQKKSPLKSEPNEEGRVFIKATIDHNGHIRPLTEGELKTKTEEEFLREWEKVEFIPVCKDKVDLNTKVLDAFGKNTEEAPIVLGGTID